MDMRKSRVLRKMREGKVATSIKLNMADARVAEMAAMCGFDCLWLDMEHVPNSLKTIESVVRTAKVYDTDVLTRVDKGSYSTFIRPLEADSTGIMVPHLMSLEEAKKIVYYTKFYPVGRRPIDGGNADGKYCMVSQEDYMKTANEERFVVVQIEDPEPMAELEEICALPGIDMIFFGPADFSHAIGMPHKIMNETTLAARKKVAECARRHGKMAGTVGGLGNYKELQAEGFNFINLGADVVGLCQYFGNIVKETQK
jgi:4-hydroxy-2-oxoheptanedioate aldolase